MENYKVYIIKNDINDKVYIGSTLNTLQYRFRGHCTQNRSELDRDITKYGKEHFWIELLEDGITDLQKVDEAENRYIQKYNSIDNGYNDRLAGSYSSRRKTTRYQDLTGMRFGRLTVIEEAGRGNDGLNWLCRCDCGNMHVVSGHQLRNTSGGIKSCGCATIEAAKKLGSESAKHHGIGTRLYSVWKSIRSRCNNPNNSAFSNYGGRGIRMCDEWNDFNAFREWAYSNGYDENAGFHQCTIDRIDVNGDYCPENCRWANASEQNLNQRDTELLSHNGKEMTICQWADYLGVKRGVFIRRKKLGWDIERIVTTPIGEYEWGSHCKKPVLCIETREIFESSESAGKCYGKTTPSLSIALDNYNRTFAGYHWVRYQGENVDSICDNYLAKLRRLKAEKEERQKNAAKLRLEQKKALRQANDPKVRSSSSYDSIRKKVICVETGKVFPSVGDAARWAEVALTNISACCNGRQDTIKGFHWKYETTSDKDYKETRDRFDNKIRFHGGKPKKKVLQVETGKVLDSMADAAKSVGLKSHSSIYDCIVGKCKTAGGYHWKYAD